MASRNLESTGTFPPKGYALFSLINCFFFDNFSYRLFGCWENIGKEKKREKWNSKFCVVSFFNVSIYLFFIISRFQYIYVFCCFGYLGKKQKKKTNSTRPCQVVELASFYWAFLKKFWVLYAWKFKIVHSPCN